MPPVPPWVSRRSVSERPDDRVAVGPVVAAVVGPGLHQLAGLLHARLDLEAARELVVRGVPDRGELHPLPGGEVELVDVVAVLAARQPRAAQDQPVGPAMAVMISSPSCCCAAHPRAGCRRSRSARSTRGGRAPCPRPPRRDGPGRRVRRPPASRRSRGMTPVGVVKVVSRMEVSPTYRRETLTLSSSPWLSSAGPEQPAAVVAVAEEGGEAGGGVEAGQAQPVDRAVLPDEGAVPVSPMRA